MSVLPVVHWPDPVLSRKARMITDAEFQAGVIDGMPISRLIDDMIETMDDESGLGLAAPQVGLSIRLCIMDPSRMDPGYPSRTIMFNPVVRQNTGKFDSREEGCLSLPGIFGPVRRRQNVVIDYRDASGIAHTVEWSDFPARVALHETDHLDGVVFIDRMLPPARAALAKSLELLRDEYAFRRRRK